jgi:hypothetical protein
VVIAGVGFAVLWCGDNAYQALRFQVHHNSSGHGNIFLLGQTQPGSWWYYFAAALIIKLTLTMLLLPMVLLAIRPKVLWNWACLSALTLLALTPAFKVQVGVRLVLPLVALGAVGLAPALVRAWHSAPALQRRLLAGVGAAAVLWSVWSAASNWPNGLCYTNELWGGTSEGYRLLSDSNYDWGQGLPELVRWQRRHGLARMDVWYFGTDPALFQLPLRELSWNTLAAQGPETLRAALHGHFLAASTSLLYGSNGADPAAQFLHGCVPVARTSTFLIFDFRD